MVVQLLRRCTICDEEVEAVTVDEDLPIFVARERDPRLDLLSGWSARISSCSGCLGRLGKPLRWIQDHLVNYAVFEGSDARVELKGAPCFTDD